MADVIYIHPATVEALPAKLRRSRNLAVSLQPDGGLAIDAEGLTLRLPEQEIPFPDVDRMRATFETPTVAQRIHCDPQYLRDACDLAMAAGAVGCWLSIHPSTQSNEYKAAVVSFQVPKEGYRWAEVLTMGCREVGTAVPDGWPPTPEK